MKTLGQITIALVLFVGMFGLLPAGLFIADQINQWEKAHAYPYGRMCDPNIFNLYRSTCGR